VPPSGTVTISITLTKKIASHGGRSYYANAPPSAALVGQPAGRWYTESTVPLADEFIPLVLRVACPPPPPPDPISRDIEYMKCVNDANLEFTKAIYHALLNELAGQAACVAIGAACLIGGVLVGPCVLACEAGLLMLALGEVALAYVALQARLANCAQKKPPPPPDGGPCDCQGPDCHPPDKDRPDDWRGVPGSWTHVRAMRHHFIFQL
jgi:hypothetical protein